MPVLIVKNIVTEGPGTIGDYLKKENIPFRIIELGKGEIPPSLNKFSTLIVLGGPAGVYEMEIHPHIMACSRIIREALNREMQILGICLGSQLLAHCLGAEVYVGPGKEIGWQSIELTGEGLKDPLMRQLAIHPVVGDFWRRFRVFHWHGDTFDLPAGGVLLASSRQYKNQAFRFGKKAYGFQFHIEVSRDMVSEWIVDMPDADEIAAGTDSVYEEYSGRAMKFYRSFFSNV